jgi:hypothetical protein
MVCTYFYLRTYRVGGIFHEWILYRHSAKTRTKYHVPLPIKIFAIFLVSIFMK